ncbi:Gfo/Idh/MocA family protein [Streptomyces meridianus]|uniref:Gfo/Idh/MocA family oxidoreductase n=1 Tax=Streptomyces meridianus TaxID=2938945 RepID=A0ABT0XCE6_9ACTN|nr:Gfo/Idh/MocA family oxidoreductase [Streptomyces meridianus]MCM2580055.1 Gfo/Idh/MocA family oxidoreductase [Streptomyces meridianus]
MRIGLLGTGPWAGRVHAPALAGHPGVEFTGVWGRRTEATEALAKESGTRAYTDVEALFADSDAVAIALPPDVQAELAVRAAEAGCHLLLDKPVATSVTAARRVADAAGRAGVASVVFFTLRFDPAVAEWVHRQSAAGGWFTGSVAWLGALFSEGADSPYAASPWRREKGALWDVGPHVLSVLLPVLGELTGPDAVTAVAGPGDTVHLVLRHDGGASSTVTVSLTAPVAAAGRAVELRGAAGTSVLPEQREDGVVVFRRAVDALTDSARSGVPHLCDVRFGARVTEILAAAEAARAT